MAFWRWVARLAGSRVSTGPDTWSPVPEQEWPEWRRRWRSMPHRRLDGPARFGLGAVLREWGEPVAVTVALAPPEHEGRLFMTTKRCPICGRKAVEPDRRSANLSPVWSNGRSLGFGVWVHPACFDGLPDAETPAPVPM